MSSSRDSATDRVKMVTMSARESRPHRWYARLLPIVLATLGVFNLSTCVALEPRYQPIRVHDDSSMTHLVHVEQTATDRRYRFYYELGDVAAGQTLQALETPIVAWMTRGLSEVELVVADYDPTLPPQAVPEGEPLGVMENEHGVFPYWILPGEGSRWMGHYQDGIVIVPESVADVPRVEQ